MNNTYVIVFLMQNGNHKALTANGILVTFVTREEALFNAKPNNVNVPNGCYAVEVWSLEDWLTSNTQKEED